MTVDSQVSTARLRWIWLFPATYALHILEEYYGGFPAWLSRIAQVNLSPALFLSLNLTALILMITGATLVAQSRKMRWLGVSFATVVILNALLHLVSSLLTRTYSPGLLSGLLCWLPLGLFALWRLKPLMGRRGFRRGVYLGLLIHSIVSLIALFGGRAAGA